MQVEKLKDIHSYPTHFSRKYSREKITKALLEQSSEGNAILFFFYGLFSVPQTLHLSFKLEKIICHNAMKICVVNKLTIVNRFVLHNLLRNITRSVIITRKTTRMLNNFKMCVGNVEKSRG